MDANTELHNLETELLGLISKCDKVTKQQGQQLTNAVSKIVNFAHKLIITNAKLEERTSMQKQMEATEQKIMLLQASVNKILEQPRTQQPVEVQKRDSTYAGVVKATKRPRVIARETAKKSQSKFTCIISPREVPAEFSSQAMREDVVKNLQPGSKNIKIRGLKVLPSKKSVVIETADASSLDAILNNTEMKKSSNIRVLGRRNPKIIIKHVPSGTEKAELVNTIKAQNQDRFPDVQLEKELSPRFKIGPKNRKSEHWVCELSPSLHKLLKEKHESCFYYREYRLKVETFVSVIQCHKCLRFGHMANYCKQEKKNCGNCGDVEHQRDQCTKKDTPSCINCVRRHKRDTNHTARDKSCPSYAEHIRLISSKTDYGY